MPLPLNDYVRHVLLERSRGVRLFKAVREAWDETSAAYPERGRWQRKSTFRGLVWEAAVRKIGEISFDDPDFKVIPHRDTVSFICEDAILMRFKHADLELATRNYPTSEAANFDNHNVDLYGFSGLQRVELVYVLNEFESDVVWVGVAAHSHGQFLWKLELSSEGIVAAPETLPLVEPEADTARLAKLKSDEVQAAREKKKKDNGRS